jgi:uncharacterized protein
VVRSDGHSDYATVFALMNEEHKAAIDARSTVIITGDARTNYRSDGVDSLQELQRRAERIYWLNPEPVDNWDTHDSSVGRYAESCDAVFEVRTLQHLTTAVEHILAR